MILKLQQLPTGSKSDRDGSGSKYLDLKFPVETRNDLVNRGHAHHQIGNGLRTRVSCKRYAVHQ